jgi:cyclophilin family peptidyl-prolyl cis-trans isomerase
MKYLLGLFFGLSLVSATLAQSLSKIRDWGSHPSEENIQALWKAYPNASEENKKTIVWAIGQHKRKEDYIKLYTILESIPLNQTDWLELTGEALAKTGEKDGIKPVWELFLKKNSIQWAGKWAFQWCMSGQGFDIEPYALEVFKNKKNIPQAWYTVLGRLKPTQGWESWKMMYSKIAQLSLDQKFFLYGFSKAWKDEKSWLPIWKKLVLKEKDVNLLVQLIKATPPLSDSTSAKNKLILKTLDQLLQKETNTSVSLTLAEYLQKNKRVCDATRFAIEHSGNKISQVSCALAKVFIADQKLSDNSIQMMWNQIDTISDPYIRGFCLELMGQIPNQHTAIVMYCEKENLPILWNYGMLALGEQLKTMINQNPTHADSICGIFYPLLERCIQSGDDAAMCVAAENLRNPAYPFLKYVKSLDFLFQALRKCKLPQQEEAKLELQKTIEFFGGWESTHHPTEPGKGRINGKITTQSTLEFITSQGNIIIQLRPDLAPETVCKMVELVENGYFSQKFFHRVVPGFVAQTGCPRGDGWGSPGFIMKSEFSEAPFVRGTVGMASAGADTESSQWFISLAPTPHLDGRYTVWGQVIQGLDVANQLKVGDYISKASVKF